MPKPLTEEDLTTLVQAIARYPEGAKLDDLLPLVNLQRRTLQRRLALLQKQGFLAIEGHGRATKYRLLQIPPAQGQQEHLVRLPEIGSEDVTLDEDGIPVSAEGQKIRAYVHLPLTKRKLVGYNRDFLDAYQANQTFYLPQAVRGEMAAMGNPFAQQILPAGTYARQIFNRLLIDLSWNSSRLEGNTYSLLETQRLIVFGQRVEGKNSLEAQMILNHKEAIEFLVESAEQVGLNRFTLLNLHAILSNNLLPDPEASGRLRFIPVNIGGSVYIPLAIPQLVEECFNQILNTASAIEDPFEQAFFMMVHLPYLQPFEDVNKRVSRLSANIPLIRNNLCPLSFIGVPDRIYIAGMLGVYEMNRVELLRDVFVWAYKRSYENYAVVRQSLGEPDPFRLRYRQQLIDVISQVVRQKLIGQDIPVFLEHWSKDKLPKEDQSHFVAIVEVELFALHEGNFARFRLRHAEFLDWFDLFKPSVGR
jgi:Fic/DOC family